VRRRRERKKRTARSSPLTPSFQSDFREERRKNGPSFHLSFRLPFFSLFSCVVVVSLQNLSKVQSRVFYYFFRLKTSFRLKEEKNFSETFYSLLISISSSSSSSLFLFERNVVERNDEDESAKKTDRGARFVEFDREVRRYLFPTHSSEIEFE